MNDVFEILIQTLSTNLRYKEVYIHMHFYAICSILTHNVDALYSTQNELNKLRISQVDKDIQIQEAGIEKIKIIVSQLCFFYMF